MLISRFSNINVETEIAQMETKFKITLPAQYRNFLIRYNGGETPETVFKIGRESSDVRAFMGFGDVTYKFPEDDEMKEWIKKGLLPIAMDSFGNYIAIGLSTMKNGIVYFCDHERGYKSKKLAKNLSDFISHCKSQKIGKIYTIEEREQMAIEDGWEKDEITDDVRAVWQAEIDKFQHIVQEKVIID